MTTENIDNVISTIKSRSQIINFDRIATEVVAEELIIRGIDEETAWVFARQSNSTKEVLALLDDEKVAPIFQLVRNIAVSQMDKSVHPLLILQNEGEVLSREPDKKYHQLFMDLLLSVANDKLYFVNNQMTKIAYKQTMQIISEFMQPDQEKIIKEVETILKFKQRLRYNVNLELFYAQLFIELAHI
jgi:DNA polymerase-3 subunit delta'